MMFTLFVVFCVAFLFLILVFLILNYKGALNQLTKKYSFRPLITTEKEKELNPDINTIDWDLHKIRLIKFGRSQYKGLTFFISSEDRIYYLSEDGNKVYC